MTKIKRRLFPLADRDVISPAKVAVLLGPAHMQPEQEPLARPARHRLLEDLPDAEQRPRRLGLHQRLVAAR